MPGQAGLEGQVSTFTFWWPFSKAIAQAPNRFDVVAHGTQLGPQSFDLDVHSPGSQTRVDPLYIIQKLVPVLNPPFPRHQGQQKSKLQRRQIYGDVVHQYPRSRFIHR